MLDEKSKNFYFIYISAKFSGRGGRYPQRKHVYGTESHRVWNIGKDKNVLSVLLSSTNDNSNELEVLVDYKKKTLFYIILITCIQCILHTFLIFIQLLLIIYSCTLYTVQGVIEKIVKYWLRFTRKKNK